jgi:hypothetical protein
LALVCPDREHAIRKPPNTSAEEFLNRQADVFKNTFIIDAADM